MTALLNVSVLPARALSALQSTSNNRTFRSKALQLQPYVICFAMLKLMPSGMSGSCLHCLKHLVTGRFAADETVTYGT